VESVPPQRLQATSQRCLAVPKQRAASACKCQNASHGGADYKQLTTFGQVLPNRVVSRRASRCLLAQLDAI